MPVPRGGFPFARKGGVSLPLKKKTRELCKYKTSEDRWMHREEILEAVREPRHICSKCLRVAGKKKFLCHAVRLGEWGR